jgi:hypothetical protein
VARRDELTPAERAWGIAAARYEGVTYQPEVVLIEEGPNAVRAMSANGLEWTLDARAAHSGDLEPGKVLYATSRVVGRVLAATRRGDDVVVVLGPVQLTDVIKAARVELSTPLDPSQLIEYQAPDYPGSVSKSATPLVPAADGSGAAPRFFVRSALARVGDRLEQDLVTPGFGVRGFGINALGTPTQMALGVAWKANGLDFSAVARMGLQTPRLDFKLHIADGAILVCELMLSGAAGLMMDLAASAAPGARNINDIVHVPADFSIPLIGQSVPSFAVTLRQSFLVKTGFTAAAALRAGGSYTVTGSIGVGYKGGQPTFAPPSLTPAVHLVDSLQGASRAIAGLNFTHQMRVIVGLGAFGFVTGPYFSLSNAAGITRQTDLDRWTYCRQSDVVMFLSAGIGYFMPRVVVDGINAVLRLINLGEIANEGGIQIVDGHRLVEHHVAQPQSNACRPR